MRVTESLVRLGQESICSPSAVDKEVWFLLVRQAMSEFSITASPTPCKVLDLKASHPQGCDKSGVARCLRKYFVYIRHSPQVCKSNKPCFC